MAIELLPLCTAGQPEFGEWAALLGDDSAAIPFLRYLPEHLSSLGARVEKALREQLAQAPSFVAFEGYETVTVLADVLRSLGGTGRALPNAGRALQSKEPAGRSSSPARRASAPGSGLGRQSKSSIEIRRNPVASGSFTPADSRDVSAAGCPPVPVSVTAGP